MKKIIAIILLVLTLSVFAEVVSVPKYGYWIYPPVGWVLQEFQDESKLSWFSSDRKLAFTINSWNGDTFTSAEEIFNKYSDSIDGDGEFIIFDYFGREALIGDVTFVHNEEKHRGWFIFINGDDFDYYIYSYSFDIDYGENYHLILSVLDSFGIGDEGKYNPGPVTVFYDSISSSYKTKEKVDFFGHSIEVDIDSNSIESSSNVIEREAKIMEGYAYSPETFYKAWVRYYQIIYRDNYNRIDPIFKEISPYINREYYDTDYKLSELLMFWIQGFTYQRRENKSSDLISPVESLVKGIGDCDSKALLLNLFLHRFGIDSIILTSEKVRHAIAGVKCSGEGAYYEYNGSKYMGVELTTKSLIGEVKEEFKDSSLWTFVDPEYDSGL